MVHILVGTIFVLLGTACVAYGGGGAAVLEREPPMVALGVMLIGVGAGMWGRSRAAVLLARVGLATLLLAIVWLIVTSYLPDPDASLHDAHELMRRVRLFGGAVIGAWVVFLLLFVRRAPHASVFSAIDMLPLAGCLAALVLTIVWLRGDDARLRPCRLGNEGACEILATRLIEAAERAPTAPPARWEARAARVLEERGCPGPDSQPCAVHLYAVGTVAARAGRVDAARQAFLNACARERSWCARAAQERAVPWTPEERATLERQ